uniref:Myb/SANT-like domain-containing protein n=1 Tax=Brassica oleracea var. oleracea TaxID=109376 RepID=A0A0D3BGL5_BRAOL
ISLSRTHLSLSRSLSLELIFLSLSRTHLSLSRSLSLEPISLLHSLSLSHALLKKWSFDGLSHAVSVLKHLGSLLSCAGEFSDTTSLGNPSLPLSDYLFKLQWHMSLEVIDEQTRFVLQLRIEEELKGNVKNKVLHETARKTIADKFYDTYGAMKRLTHNRTGQGYHPDGSIDMSDDWWEQRCKEWPGARKYKDKPVANADLMEQIFSGVHVSGAEGWSAQQGENELDNMEVENDDAASEARQTNPPARQTNPEPDAPSSSNGPRVSNAPRASTVPQPSRKRRAEQGADVMRSSLQSRDDILSHKNHLIESHPDLSCSQLKAMSVLHSLSSIRMWSPLYKAAYKHLREAATNRQTFLSYEDDENKIIYLEEETG